MSGNNKSEPVTKADLQELAQTTSAGLNRAETHLQKLESGLNVLDTRVGRLEAVTNNIAVELAKTQADVREIKHDMATKIATKDDISRIMNAIDTYTAEAISYRNCDVIRGRAIMDHDGKLKDHETRLTALETK